MYLSLPYGAQSDQYTFNKPRHQCFPFPSFIISYILNNPLSYMGYQKLNQTCKYFLLKQKIMFFKGNAFCLDDYIWMNACQIPIRIEKRNVPFWFIDSLRLSCNFNGFHKVYRCTLTSLTLEKITLSLKEFNILTSSNTIKKFVFRYSAVKNDDAMVPIDVIFGKLLNMVEFDYLTFYEDFSFQTFDKMNQLNFSDKFQVFTLWMLSIQENFDPEIVCKFIEKNAASSAKICIAVNLTPFKQELEHAINDLMKKWEGLKPTIRII